MLAPPPRPPRHDPARHLRSRRPGGLDRRALVLGEGAPTRPASTGRRRGSAPPSRSTLGSPARWTRAGSTRPRRDSADRRRRAGQTRSPRARRASPTAGVPKIQPGERPPYTSGEVPLASQTTFPLSTNGLLIGKLPGFGDYSCSATVISSESDSVLITAGHCVYDFQVGFAKRVAFAPAYHQGDTPFGVWSAADLIATLPVAAPELQLRLRDRAPGQGGRAGGRRRRRRAGRRLQPAPQADLPGDRLPVQPRQGGEDVELRRRLRRRRPARRQHLRQARQRDRLRHEAGRQRRRLVHHRRRKATSSSTR